MLTAFALICALSDGRQSSVVNTFPGADEVYLWGQGLADGRHFEYVVQKRDFEKVPAWVPEKDPLPLTIARAIEIAKRVVRADHPEFPDLMPWTIELHQAGSGRRNIWFYILHFYPVVEGGPSIYSEISVVALMDGTVVKPREKKDISK
jgi:hypothetical protein